MKTNEKGFTIPVCVFADRLSHTSLAVLIFLISRSSCTGWCIVSYPDIMTNCGIGSRNTVVKVLADLEKRNWIISRSRVVNGGCKFLMSIPDQLRQKFPIGVLPGDVIQMPRLAHNHSRT